MSGPTTNHDNVFERSGALRPGDVVLAFAGPAPTKSLLGTWLQTVAREAQQQDATIPVFVIGLESSVMGASSVRQAVTEIRQAVGDRMAEPVIIELATEEAEAGLATFPFQKEHAIIALLDVERLRFIGSRSSGPLTKNVDGTYIRVSEAEDLALPHVEKLCAAICRAAPNAGQKWLIISRGYGFGSTVPATLAPLENLDIHQLREESHDPALTGEFRKLLANVQAVGADQIFKWVEERLPAGKTASIARANIFSLSGQPIQAYKTISGVSEQIIANGCPEEIIQLVQMALAAGQRPDAAKWVLHLPAPRTLQLENLRAARLLAKQLGDDPLCSACIVEFRHRFPHDPLTELDHFNELLEAKNYSGAAAQAETTGNPFRRAVALFLSDPAQSPAPLLSAAEVADEMPQAFWILAKSAKQRKDYGACRDSARRLANDKEYAAQAAALRVGALRDQIPGISEDDLHRELADLLEWCARHPAELAPRFDLEALFDSVSTARECVTHSDGQHQRPLPV